MSHAGEVEFGPSAPVDGNLAEDFFELRRRWLDRWIKGLANGIDEEPPVRVFVMGGGSGRRNRDGRLDHGGRWRSAVAWPLPQTRWTRLYLHADRSLAAEPAAGSGALDFAFDPHDPAPTVGGAISSGDPHTSCFRSSRQARGIRIRFTPAPVRGRFISLQVALLYKLRPPKCRNRPALHSLALSCSGSALRRRQRAWPC